MLRIPTLSKSSRSSPSVLSLLFVALTFIHSFIHTWSIFFLVNLAAHTHVVSLGGMRFIARMHSLARRGSPAHSLKTKDNAKLLHRTRQKKATSDAIEVGDGLSETGDDELATVVGVDWGAAGGGARLVWACYYIIIIFYYYSRRPRNLAFSIDTGCAHACVALRVACCGPEQLQKPGPCREDRSV